MMYFLLGVSLSANAFCLWNMNNIRRRVDELDEIMTDALEESLEQLDEEVETWQSAN